MKIKEGYLLRTIADTNIVVPVAERVIDFKGMIVLNDSTAAIWRFMEKGREYGEIVDYMISTYDIDKETAQKDLNAWLKQMEDRGILDR